jgi:DNA-3-methyladenine glycosylase
MNAISNDFFLQDNVVQIARLLIGMNLHTLIDGKLCVAKITETEAYRGYNDRACHANNGRRTTRTAVFYESGGHAYVYLCYGIHRLFNIITNVAGKADAVLIRSVEPIEGMKVMQERRNYFKVDKQLSTGPGRLTQAMGIGLEHNKHLLKEGHIWVSEGSAIPTEDVLVSTRIGVNYAGEDALLPWRFCYKKSEFFTK